MANEIILLDSTARKHLKNLDALLEHLEMIEDLPNSPAPGGLKDSLSYLLSEFVRLKVKETLERGSSLRRDPKVRRPGTCADSAPEET